MPDSSRPDEPGWPSDDHDGTQSLAEQDTLWVRRPGAEAHPQATQPVQHLKPQGSLFQPAAYPEPEEQSPQWPAEQAQQYSGQQAAVRQWAEQTAALPHPGQEQQAGSDSRPPWQRNAENQPPQNYQGQQGQSEHGDPGSQGQRGPGSQQGRQDYSDQQDYSGRQGSPGYQEQAGQQEQRSPQGSTGQGYPGQPGRQGGQREQQGHQDQASQQGRSGQPGYQGQGFQGGQQDPQGQPGQQGHRDQQGHPGRQGQSQPGQQGQGHPGQLGLLGQQDPGQDRQGQGQPGQQGHPGQQGQGQPGQQGQGHPGQQGQGQQEGNRPQVPVVPAVVHAQPMRIEPSGEQRPAPATTGAEEGPPAATEVEPKRRRKWPWIAAALVVLLVLGGGTVAAVQPAVANRLELPWAPNKPKGDPPAALAVNRQLQAPGPSAPSPTPEGVAAALKGPAAAAALGTLSGSVIDPATGTALWAKDADKPLTPASTTKVLTVAAALLAVDHGHQISTKVVQGADPGTAIVVAGGDPTINSLSDGKDSIYPGSAHLDDLVKQVMEASGGKIKQVQLDLSVFQGETFGPGWAPEDAPSTYAAVVEPVMLDGGRSSATDEKSMRVANPAKSFADKFASKLGATAGGNAKAPEGAKVLGEIKSAPLTELISNVLNHSDNLMGDAVARQTALATGEKGSFEGGAKATEEVLKKNGFDLQGVELFDGSGLSVDNRIPAKVLAEVLSVAAAPDGKDPRTAKLRPLLGDLSVAGGSTGRLVSRYTSGPEEAGKGWVRAKTGTLSGVNTLAGVVLDKDGHLLVFALMSLGSESDAARSALDAVVAELRGCGCR